jgi:Fructose-2,6-bisphosphatase
MQVYSEISTAVVRRFKEHEVNQISPILLLVNIPMSYLIPTQNDYEDAHSGLEQEVEYRQVFENKKNDKDSKGNWKYPWTFEVINGFFKQSEASTDDLKFNYALDNFGRLLEWKDIISNLQSLNENAKENESYKLIFFARHGQGFHNVCVNTYGIEAWNTKWHSMETDGINTWAPDPMLTELGIKQAKENNQAWKQQMDLGAPMPSKFYVSPLQRSSHTLVHTWNGLKPDTLRPIVVESIRETIGSNLCDKRSTKTVIDQRFGGNGFITDQITEEDELFTERRETMVEQSLRVNEFLQSLFEEDVESNQVEKKKVLENTFISTTSHAGTIRCFVNVLGHRHFTISTGGMIPIVVKATRKL